ncbi:hypothetical protein H1R20_g15058, partial [Candolleomyces eurysporus]
MDAHNAIPVDRTFWRKLPGGRYFERLVCKSQRDDVQVLGKHCSQHENTGIHRTNAQKLRYRHAYPPAGSLNQPVPDNIAQPIIESATFALVHSIARPHQPPPTMADNMPWFQPEDFSMDTTVEEQEVVMSREIARNVLDVLFDNDSSDDLDEDPPSSESSEEEDEIPQVPAGGTSAQRKRRLEDLFGEEKDWYPWLDKIVNLRTGRHDASPSFRVF